MAKWTSSLPITFAAENVGQISLKVDYVTSFNAMVPSASLQGGPSSTLAPSSPPRTNSLLKQLAIAMSSVGHSPRTQDAKICRELLQHIAEPERYKPPLQVYMMAEKTLFYVLWSMHVQAVAAQELARELGWYESPDGMIAPLLPREPGNLGGK